MVNPLKKGWLFLAAMVLWISSPVQSASINSTSLSTSVSLAGIWTFKETLSNGELDFYEGSVSSSPARVFQGTKPFFPSVVPRALDLFRSFTEVFLRKAPILWEKFETDPQSITSHLPRQFTIVGTARKARASIFPLLHEGKAQRLLVFCFVKDRIPYYLLWRLPHSIDDKAAYETSASLFQLDQ